MIELATHDGRALEIDASRAAVCDGCGAQQAGDGETDIALADVCLRSRAGAPDLEIALCGGCVAEGLAILLGRRHVQAGGDIGDLT